MVTAAVMAPVETQTGEQHLTGFPYCIFMSIAGFGVDGCKDLWVKTNESAWLPYLQLPSPAPAGGCN